MRTLPALSEQIKFDSEKYHLNDEVRLTSLRFFSVCYAFSQPRPLLQLFNVVVARLVKALPPDTRVYIFETGLLTSLLLQCKTTQGPTGRKWSQPKQYFSKMTVDNIKQVGS